MQISINTDGPKMFNNSLSEEYDWLVEKLGFTRDDVRFLITNAIDMSWLLPDQKRELKDQFTSDPSWSRNH
jgi:adenosine deaminase